MIRIVCRTCGGSGMTSYSGRGEDGPDPCPGCDENGWQYVDELGPDDDEFVVTGVGTMVIDMDEIPGPHYPYTDESLRAVGLLDEEPPF